MKLYLFKKCVRLGATPYIRAEVRSLIGRLTCCRVTLRMTSVLILVVTSLWVRCLVALSLLLQTRAPSAVRICMLQWRVHLVIWVTRLVSPFVVRCVLNPVLLTQMVLVLQLMVVMVDRKLSVGVSSLMKPTSHPP